MQCNAPFPHGPHPQTKKRQKSKSSVQENFVHFISVAKKDDLFGAVLGLLLALPLVLLSLLALALRHEVVQPEEVLLGEHGGKVVHHLPEADQGQHLVNEQPFDGRRKN